MSASLLPADPCARPGFGRALATFHRVARHVPAYADFLAGHGVEVESVRTVDDFAAVPAVTKANYLQRYPLDMLLWHGDVGQAGTWSTSSGSSGRPTYWPRDLVSLEEATELYARVFRHSFHSHRRSTLLVIGFAMGDWIGGTYTYAAALGLRRRGHKLSVVTPGLDVETILGDIAELGPYYDQVVLAGYPPFVKDVLDRASDIVLRQDLRILLAGENHSEQWRDYVLERIGKPGQAGETCLIYGTADAGIMGHETRTSIAVRRLARDDQRLNRALFGEGAAQPTFVEYDADYRFTEVDGDGRFLFTVDTAIPLVRYRINDQGTVLSAADLADLLRAHDHRAPIFTSTESCGFLALHRRTDIAANFYALKIYPENIRTAMEDQALAGVVSGKFVLSTDTDERFEQSLRLRVELRAGARIDDTLIARLHRLVVEALNRTNREYRRLHEALGPLAEPVISLHQFGTGGFGPGAKHQWTERPL
jgi:phenylacetate-CoA ligase